MIGIILLPRAQDKGGRQCGPQPRSGEMLQLVFASTVLVFERGDHHGHEKEDANKGKGQEEEAIVETLAVGHIDELVPVPPRGEEDEKGDERAVEVHHRPRVSFAFELILQARKQGRESWR